MNVFDGYQCHVHIYHHNVSIHAILGMEREKVPPKMKNKIILVSQEKKKELFLVCNFIFGPIGTYSELYFLTFLAFEILIQVHYNYSKNWILVSWRLEIILVISITLLC